jgi:hypothetical protein
MDILYDTVPVTGLEGQGDATPYQKKVSRVNVGID